MSIVSLWRSTSVASVVLAGIAASAHAEKVLIDFGSNSSYRGLSVNPNPDANGNYWNSIQPGYFYGPGTTAPAFQMVDTTGALTNDGQGFTTPVGTDSYNGPAGATDNLNNPNTKQANGAIDAAKFTLGASLGDLRNNYAAIDYATGDYSGNPSRFALTGLNTAEKYSLVFFGSHTYDTRTTTYSVFADSGYTTSLGSANLDIASIDPNTGGEVPNLNNVVTISNLSPTPDSAGATTGSLYVQFFGFGGGGDGDGNGYLNSMEIIGVTVPEPAAIAACVVVGLLGGRRRRVQRDA